jgi:ribosome-binding factor A
MTARRASRLNEQFKREISAILTRKVRDPRVGHLLVTAVQVTADLWMARVFFRLQDGDRDEAEVLEGLKAAAPFIRTELGKILRIRRIPELRFQFDTTLDSATRIEEVLREVLPSVGDEETQGAIGNPEPDGSGEDRVASEEEE